MPGPEAGRAGRLVSPQLLQQPALLPGHTLQVYLGARASPNRLFTRLESLQQAFVCLCIPRRLDLLGQPPVGAFVIFSNWISFKLTPNIQLQ